MEVTETISNRDRCQLCSKLRLEHAGYRLCEHAVPAFTPNAATGGVNLADYSDSTVQRFNASRDEGEAAIWFALKESEARKIVAAAEAGRAHQVVDVLKLQPWWPDLVRSVRTIRHLYPGEHIELSKRPLEMAEIGHA